jgi:hypothetical protein
MPIVNLIEHAWLVIFICLISYLLWQQHQVQLERLIPFCSRTSVCALESPRAEAPVPGANISYGRWFHRPHLYRQ